MRKIIIAVGLLLLTASASIDSYAQDADKKPQTTIDAWRQALPGGVSSDPPTVVMDESTNNVEVKETAAQIESRIFDLERRLMDAFNKRDSIALNQLLADDFVPAGADLTESQAEKNRFIEATLKNTDTKTYVPEKTKVRVYSTTTAVVTTYYKQQKVVGGAPAATVDFTATDVWLKRKKQWQAVSHHVTELPKTASPVSRPAQAKQGQ